MICPHCGREAKDGAVFCTQCGTRLEEESAAHPSAAHAANPSGSMPAAASPDAAPASPAEPPSPDPAGKPVKKRTRAIAIAAAAVVALCAAGGAAWAMMGSQAKAGSITADAGSVMEAVGASAAQDAEPAIAEQAQALYDEAVHLRDEAEAAQRAAEEEAARQAAEAEAALRASCRFTGEAALPNGSQPAFSFEVPTSWAGRTAYSSAVTHSVNGGLIPNAWSYELQLDGQTVVTVYVASGGWYGSPPGEVLIAKGTTSQRAEVEARASSALSAEDIAYIASTFALA